MVAPNPISSFDIFRKFDDTSEMERTRFWSRSNRQQKQSDTWHEKLEAWLPLCAEARTREDELDCLGFLLAHLELATGKVRSFVDVEENTSRIEQLLELGASDSAVAELLRDTPHGFMMSRSLDGRTICTIVVPGMADEISFKSHSEPMARIGAAAQAMIKLAGGNTAPASLFKAQFRN
ncbi:hypothetical protein [Erythrobacter alti]|uniref:hypothetical protein n=1 Tax=Erythrobacter alti TaxID=1896145 RepID=UPI0030F4A028